jgi:hypothetical protein
VVSIVGIDWITAVIFERGSVSGDLASTYVFDADNADDADDADAGRLTRTAPNCRALPSWQSDQETKSLDVIDHLK